MSKKPLLLPRFYLVLLIASAFAHAGPEQDLRRAIIENNSEDLYLAYHADSEVVFRMTKRDGTYVNLAAKLALKQDRTSALVTLLQIWSRHIPTADKQETPLHMAVRFNEPLAASVLIRRNADIDARGQSGWTPLHIACSLELVEMARMLLENGALRALRTSDGQSAADIADGTHNEELIRLFHEPRRRGVTFADPEAAAAASCDLAPSVESAQTDESLKKAQEEFAWLLEQSASRLASALDDASPRITTFVSPGRVLRQLFPHR